MKGTPAIYLGRLVSKDNFRAFVYAPDGTKRLVESWDEFQALMQTGLWFAELKTAKESVTLEKPKAKSRPKTAKKKEKVPSVAAPDEAPKSLEKHDLAFEVTDDFLP